MASREKYIEYIFKKELSQTINNTNFNGNPIKHYNYRYTIINTDGTPISLKIGKFDLVEIGVDTRYFKKFTGHEISLFDLSKKTLRKFTSMTEDENFIIKYLLPTFETLKMTNSWDIYTKLVELDSVKEKIIKLNTEIEKYKETISEFKSKLTNSRNSSK